MSFKAIYEQVVAHPRYQANILYGKPRKGHAEGTVKAHIADLESNLASLVEKGLVEADSERYWKLKVLIHVHDSFKMEAKRDSPILDRHSHASLAKAFLTEYTKDQDILNIVQYHDLGYAIYKGFEKTGTADINRLMRALNQIYDLDLFLLFAIIDACTPSKGRLVIKWFVVTVVGLFPRTTVRLPDVLPDTVEG